MTPRARSSTPSTRRAGRAVRRDHRLHRPARHVRPRRQLPVRAGRGGRHRCPPDHDRRPDAAARPPGVHRTQGDEPQAEAEPGGERTPNRGRRQQGLLARLGRPGPAPPLVARRRRTAGDRDPRSPLLLAPPRFGRPGHRPGRHDDPSGLRHAVGGVRTGLQRAAAAGSRGRLRLGPTGGAHGGRRRRRTARCGQVVGPNLVPSPPARGHGRLHHGVPDHITPRTPPPPISSTTCGPTRSPRRREPRG